MSLSWTWPSLRPRPAQYKIVPPLGTTEGTGPRYHGYPAPLSKMTKEKQAHKLPDNPQTLKLDKEPRKLPDEPKAPKRTKLKLDQAKQSDSRWHQRTNVE